jgi:CRP-like cAMP-binding protein
VIRVSSDGETVIHVLGRGEFTGDVNLLSGRGTLIRVRILEACTLLEIDRPNLRRVMQTDAALGVIFLNAFLLRRVYLISRIEASQQITVTVWTKIEALEGDTHLKRVLLRNTKTGASELRDIQHVFMMTGADQDLGFGPADGLGLVGMTMKSAVRITVWLVSRSMAVTSMV